MPNKSLGQHWLKDRMILDEIADSAHIEASDTVLEIGPGLGTLTSVLLSRAEKVVAVEYDALLAQKLPRQFPGKNLEVITSDILSFDLSVLPPKYVVVANVPYYITSKIVQLLLQAENKPKRAVLLVQKEVAERLAAHPGDMSILAVSAQLFAKVTLGSIVPAAFFTPAPKVDSRVVILETHSAPLFDTFDEKLFFRMVKAGFSAKRKKLISSLGGGLHLSRDEVLALLEKAGIDANLRAEQLSLADWQKITEVYGRD